MKNIFIAGQNGMVGSSIKRLLLSKYNNIHIINSSKKSLNLINQQQVLDFLKKKKINEVYLAATKLAEYMQIIHILQNSYITIS